MVLDLVLKYWVECCFGLMGTAMAALYRRLKRYTLEQDAVKLGIQALIRNEIIQIYNRCYDKGFCPIYALENIEAMYVQYAALGGNGTIKELVERVRNMPTEKNKG